MIIDTHHHLWTFNNKDFGWMTPSMEILKQDFLSDAYEKTMKNIHGTILVQARQSREETNFLLDFANHHHKVKGVIGWLDICGPSLESDLESYIYNPVFKGLRHVIHDESDLNFMLKADFIRGLKILEDKGLIYELLIFPKHLPKALKLASQLPKLNLIVDHIAKPNIKEALLVPWSKDLLALSKCPNVSIKLSGLVTEHDWSNWKEEDFHLYLDTVYEAFGEDRVLFGSDWPVCLLAASYDEVLNIIKSWSKKLTQDQQDKLFYKNALHFYKLNID